MARPRKGYVVCPNTGDRLYTCGSCKEIKPSSEYYRSSTNEARGHNDGISHVCKSCSRTKATAWYRRNLEKSRAATNDRMKQTRPMRVYGISHEDIAQLLAEQDGKCAICGKSTKRPCVDHDHQTGRIRGLLCVKCNTALGALGDDIDGIERAIAYLERSVTRPSDEYLTGNVEDLQEEAA